jgi:hypothetical protein
MWDADEKLIAATAIAALVTAIIVIIAQFV